ncbi:endoplasmic reticulum chaperone BiP-like [Ochotona princeps]|uniref:endoplasmic reticulum chaperone BiP-like n=1 Tax=Ochotona princeps TaxID=9978 RepID=UPI0027148D68|nr:endoplasmic reticulum chaperone BiP-like [Ochotona princeps]
MPFFDICLLLHHSKSHNRLDVDLFPMDGSSSIRTKILQDPDEPYISIINQLTDDAEHLFGIQELDNPFLKQLVFENASTTCHDILKHEHNVSILNINPSLKSNETGVAEVFWTHKFFPHIRPTLTLKFQLRQLTIDNQLLGIFDLTGIPSAPRGVPQIEVTFEIDVNSILRVTAEDKGTGNKHKIIITNDQNRLTPEEIRRMVNNAKKFAEEYKKLKEHIDNRNELESDAYSLKNQIGDKEKLVGKLSSENKETMEKAMEEKIELLESHQDANIEDFKAKKKELEDIFQPIISKLYGSTGPPPTGDEDTTEKMNCRC